MEELRRQIEEEERKEKKSSMFVLKRFMTPEEMQAYFGITLNTLKAWMERGLPVYEVSPRKHYYKDTDIEDFIQKSMIYNRRGALRR